METRPEYPAEGDDVATRIAPADSSSPILSIGLPVYNGSKHLREAVESLLAQDVGDLELVISDNASTDGTPAICAEYAEKDPRVRVVRNPQNIGAAANFNRAFELCRGRYFMWGSDDDIWDSRFAKLCIEKLAEHPDAVLCTSEVELIGSDGTPRAESYEPMSTEGMHVGQRVHELIGRNVWYDMYGVMRSESVRATALYSPTFGGDVHFLLELSLLGEFLVVPKTLFKYRVPDTRKTASEQASEIGVAASRVDQHGAPWSFLARDLAAVVTDSDLDQTATDVILLDFAKTLGREESLWGREILRERGWVVPPPRWAAENEIRSVIDPAVGTSLPFRVLKRAHAPLATASKHIRAFARRLTGRGSDQ
jgi:hypothetical protein